MNKTSDAVVTKVILAGQLLVDSLAGARCAGDTCPLSAKIFIFMQF